MVNFGMQKAMRLTPTTVQIITRQACAGIAMDYSIGIQHGHHVDGQLLL